jgi:copper chaperone
MQDRKLYVGPSESSLRRALLFDWTAEFTQLVKEKDMNESVVLAVTGMKCGGCETNITDKLKAIAGVSSVKASHKDNEVIIVFDAEKTSLDNIKNAIAEAGFTVTD